jgi:hypothetical protein
MSRLRPRSRRAVDGGQYLDDQVRDHSEKPVRGGRRSLHPGLAQDHRDVGLDGVARRKREALARAEDQPEPGILDVRREPMAERRIQLPVRPARRRLGDHAAVQELEATDLGPVEPSAPRLELVLRGGQAAQRGPERHRRRA